MAPLGYHGKLLHIDLAARTSWLETPADDFWRLYGGGGLLATYYLLRSTVPGLDALAPENLLLFTSSVVAGHPYAGLARYTVAAKSPLTGGIGETRCEGPFGIALKGSGADALVFHGMAERPTVAVVEDGRAAFHDAGSLWGQTVGQAVDGLEARFGPGIHTAVIGPAGERQVRYASVVSDRTYAAARMGMGAVMGAKRLKAVVLQGDARPQVANPARCAEITEAYRAKMRDNPLTRWQLEPPGFAAWVELHGVDAALCTHNYQLPALAGVAAYAPDRFLAHYRDDGNCPGCPNNCIKFFAPTRCPDGRTTNGGPAAAESGYDPRAGGMHQELPGALGPNCGIDDLDVLCQANILCNELGLDPTSLGFTLSMAMECVQRGLLAPEATGMDLRFGNGAALLAMIRQIAQRQGFGHVLAEGSRRAAARMGPGAERYALHVKGLEMVCFEPRSQTNLALGYATAPIGPRYDICEHDWDFDTQVGWEHTLESSRTLGILQRVPMEALSLDKVRNFVALSTLWSAADALDMCIFAIAPTRVLTMHDMADLLGAVTGWNTSAHEIMRFGERRLHLMRVYNLREGLGAADDTLPARFFEEPIGGNGRWAYTRLDRQRFQEMIRAYYRMMGWDDLGRPTHETLVDQQLAWTTER
jgi:aldehyde:ferredoxin oxidoreductase